MRWKLCFLGLICNFHFVFSENLCKGVDSGSFVADPESCDQFYYCENGQEGERVACPSGMWFNTLTNICDLKEHVTCDVMSSTTVEDNSEIITTEKPTSTTESTTTTSIGTTKFPKPMPPFPTTTTISGSQDDLCKGENPNIVKFVKSIKSCREYFICFQGRALKQECLPELHWNDATKKCDFPEVVKCDLNTEVESLCPPHGQSVYPHPTRCDHFVYCINGFKILQQCLLFQHFDIISNTCIWKTHAKCILDNK